MFGQQVGMLLGYVSLPFTATAGKRFGNRYYLISAILRPLGIMFISWGWVEVLGQHGAPLTKGSFFSSPGPYYLIGLLFLALAIILVRFWPTFFFLFFLWGAIRLSAFVMGELRIELMLPNLFPELLLYGGFIFGALSISSLGVRISFFHRRRDDCLCTIGAYRFVRHPQLLAALVMVFSSIFLVNLDNLPFALANAFVFELAIFIVIVIEEYDLTLSFGEQYLAYARQVPMILPLLLDWRVLMAPDIPEASASTTPRGKAKPKTAGIFLLILLFAFILVFGAEANGVSFYRYNLDPVGRMFSAHCRLQALAGKVEKLRQAGDMDRLREIAEGRPGDFSERGRILGAHFQNIDFGYCYCLGKSLWTIETSPKVIDRKRQAEALLYAREICKRFSILTDDH